VQFIFVLVLLYKFYAIKTINDLNLSSDGDTVTPSINIVTNYALMTESPWKDNQTVANISKLRERQLELEEVLRRNLDHPLVKNVHLLVNQESAKERLLALPLGPNKQKIIVKRILTMPKYRDFFDYINERLLNSIVAFINMDIYLGEGFKQVNRTTLVEENVCYAPTRSGKKELTCDMSRRRGYCKHGYIGVHDAYIFVMTKRLTATVLSELDYPMNAYGAENVFLWVLRTKLHMKLRNPCEQLRNYHLHCVDIHGSTRPRINRNGKSADIPESGL
jgi:hypothetical protein